MAATTTSYVLATKQTWPFVVIADFERRTFETSGLVSPDMIVFSPIVDQTLRDKWNDFTMMNRNWTIQVSVEVRSGKRSIVSCTNF